MSSQGEQHTEPGPHHKAFSTSKPAVILIHGAWHGAATWGFVKPLLEQRGFTVKTPDLPGAGAFANTPLSSHRRPLDRGRFATEPSPNAEVTQQQRTQAIISLVNETVNETGRSVVLVGHSLGGLTVSAVAEAVPHNVQDVVYLSAFMLPSAMAATALTNHPAMASSSVRRTILANPQTIGAMRADFRSEDPAYRSLLKDCFALDVSDAIFDRLRFALHCDEPLSVFLTPIALTASRFGRVPRHYIRCLEDRAVPLVGQTFMIRSMDAEMGTPTHIYDLATSHAPYASQPGALAELLASIAGPRSAAIRHVSSSDVPSA